MATSKINEAKKFKEYLNANRTRLERLTAELSAYSLLQLILTVLKKNFSTEFYLKVTGKIMSALNSGFSGKEAINGTLDYYLSGGTC